MVLVILSQTISALTTMIAKTTPATPGQPQAMPASAQLTSITALATSKRVAMACTAGSRAETIRLTTRNRPIKPMAVVMAPRTDLLNPTPKARPRMVRTKNTSRPSPSPKNQVTTFNMICIEFSPLEGYYEISQRFDLLFLFQYVQNLL